MVLPVHFRVSAGLPVRTVLDFYAALAHVTLNGWHLLCARPVCVRRTQFRLSSSGYNYNSQWTVNIKMESQGTK